MRRSPRKQQHRQDIDEGGDIEADQRPGDDEGGQQRHGAGDLDGDGRGQRLAERRRLRRPRRDDVKQPAATNT